MPTTDQYRLDADVTAFSVPDDAVHGHNGNHPLGRIIGQPRAVQALRLAVAIRAKGYNVFAAGLSGTGKRTAVMRILKEQRFDPARLRDIAIVNRFSQPDRPRALYFSAGDAARFARKLHELIGTLQQQMRLAMEDRDYRQARDGIMMEVDTKEGDAIKAFEERVEREGFRIAQVNEDGEERGDLHIVLDGEEVAIDQVRERYARGRIDTQRWLRIRSDYYRSMDEMSQVLAGIRDEREAAEDRIAGLRLATLRPLVETLVARMARDFIGDDIREYLDELREDVLENLALFIAVDGVKEHEIAQELQRYHVNILIDHGQTTKIPVLFESHPDYAKLFGSQDAPVEGEVKPPFLTLKSGSVLRASGGYLVLRAEDVLTQEDLWNALKRVMQDNTTEIRGPAAPLGMPLQSVKSDSIEVDVKVVVMGSELVYDHLFYRDEEFGKLFKILSEFDTVMDYNDESRGAYLDFVRMICQEEGLLPVDPGGKAAVLEYGIRLSEFRDKLSTRFSLIADLLRESNHWAGVAGGRTIDRAAVERARAVRRYLHNLPEEKYDEQIASGEMILQVTGSQIGAINGLSVLDRGYYAFGRPMLITARVAPGSDGIINIERESGLSGELHDKGVYIIQGYLQATYATDFPLAINAGIAFEQSYAEVDGDSASSTEVYVLLSAIGNLPLRQDIAVTGSVNQFGRIQPVGGISEKIEGFYATCKLAGLTGDQGVIIPRTNIQNLILSREVQTAISRRSFHIYAIEHVDQGITILTGLPSGTRANDGHFPKDTVNGIVERRLREMAAQVKNAT